MFKNELKEKDVEKYLRDEIKKVGGIAYKFVSPGNAGVPDRLVLLPDGLIFFVELKAPGKKTRKIQDRQIDRIEKLGFSVWTIDSKDQVDHFIDIVKGLYKNGIHTT